MLAGNIDSINNIGAMVEHGHFFNKNLKKAMEIYEFAANKYEHDGSAYNLAILYKGKDVEKDIVKAIHFLKVKFCKFAFALSFQHKNTLTKK